jgi:hypothetical protein
MEASEGVAVPWLVGTDMLMGALAVFFGAVAAWTGRPLPGTRRRAGRPRLQGVGAVLIGSACLGQAFFYFRVTPRPRWDVLFFSTNALILCGLTLLTVAGPARSVSSRTHD